MFFSVGYLRHANYNKTIIVCLKIGVDILD